AESGQPVTVTLNAHNYTGSVAANGSWSVLVAAADAAALANGSSYQVTASVTDKPGNPAPQAIHNLAVDTAAPAIAIGTIAGDELVNADEHGPVLPLAGTPTGAESGQPVTVALNGHSYAGTVAANGSWSVSVLAADVLALANG